MKFEKINLQTWERGSVFQHFINDLRCVMSMTVDIDITDFLESIHQKDYKFYPAMMWVVSSAVNNKKEFHMGYDKQENVGVWDFVSPYYADFHKEDERFVRLVTEYHPDFHTFYNRFLENRRRYKDLWEFELKEIPTNTFIMLSGILFLDDFIKNKIDGESGLKTGEYGN